MGVEGFLKGQFDIYNNNPQIVIQAYDDDEPILWIEFKNNDFLSALQGTINSKRNTFAKPKDLWNEIAPHIMNQGLGWGEGEDYVSIDRVISQIPEPYCTFVVGGKPVLQVERENGND